MKISTLRITILSLLLSAMTTSALAEIKTILLKDGSQVKGEITSMADGVYTVNNETFGEISVKDEDILNISTGSSAPQAQAQPMQLPSQGQFSDMQQQLMADPAIMEQAQELLNNPEIMNLISDPKFMQDLMTYDPAKIESNPNTQQLMNNPQFKQLMENAAGKISTEEIQNTEE